MTFSFNRKHVSTYGTTLGKIKLITLFNIFRILHCQKSYILNKFFIIKLEKPSLGLVKYKTDTYLVRNKKMLLKRFSSPNLFVILTEHVSDQINDPMTVSTFVVIPGNKFDKICV